MKLTRGADAPNSDYRGRGAQSLDRLVGGRFIATLPPWSVKVLSSSAGDSISLRDCGKRGPSLANEAKYVIYFL